MLPQVALLSYRGHRSESCHLALSSSSSPPSACSCLSPEEPPFVEEWEALAFLLAHFELRSASRAAASTGEGDSLSPAGAIMQRRQFDWDRGRRFRRPQPSSAPAFKFRGAPSQTSVSPDPRARAAHLASAFLALPLDALDWALGRVAPAGPGEDAMALRMYDFDGIAFQVFFYFCTFRCGY